MVGGNAVKPSGPQMMLLELTRAERYARPASPTHAARCDTTSGKLAVTAKACVKQGWLKAGSGGKYELTKAGLEVLPTKRTVIEDDYHVDNNGEVWLF